jgi:hypothetical protein
MWKGINMVVVQNILSLAAPNIGGEIVITGGHNAYFGVWEGKL